MTEDGRQPRRKPRVRRHRIAIGNRRGLHARAAALFVKTASAFDAEVTVRKDSDTVSGISIMGLMMLAAGHGSEITLIAKGPEAQQAIRALSALIEANFQEE
ncbi:MAG: HPr family phosphocarrier protein [Rhodospirillales bacterium]|jgi:phosphocarrier protein|nr:HPr family phosphocarrier protein [Rhodospirillales bacterium]